MTWVNLSSAFSYGSQLTSTQMQNLRDNITAMANGDSGAPSIQTAALANSSVTTVKIPNSNVDKNKLKTSTGSSSGSVSARTSVLFSMQDYCFFPNMGAGSPIYAMSYGSASAVYTGRFGFYNDSGGSVSYAVYYRYVTASDKPFLYIARDKDGKVIQCWESEDPPPGYWGLDEKPEGFEPPIIMLDADKNIIKPASEEVQFNVDIEFLKSIRDKARVDKATIASIMDSYELKDNIFVSKNISEI
jgi:hypothetical protein